MCDLFYFMSVRIGLDVSYLQVCHDRPFVTQRRTARQDSDVPSCLGHERFSNSRKCVRKFLDCSGCKDVSTIIQYFSTCGGTYVSNWRFLVWSDWTRPGFSSFRDLRYCSQRSFISSDSFRYFSLINSVIIANLPFGGSSPGWSASHWFLYSFHSLSTSVFHLLSYVNAWYACQGWSIFGGAETLRRLVPPPEFNCLLLLWNHSLMRWNFLSRLLCHSFKLARTLSYLSLFLLVANSIEPSASCISSWVTAGTGHFSRNSLKTVGKNSLVAVLLIFAVRYSVLRESSHCLWSSEVQGLRVISMSV